jgi:hypothetical protein
MGLAATELKAYIRLDTLAYFHSQKDGLLYGKSKDTIEIEFAVDNDQFASVPVHKLIGTDGIQIFATAKDFIAWARQRTTFQSVMQTLERVVGLLIF